MKKFFPDSEGNAGCAAGPTQMREIGNAPHNSATSSNKGFLKNENQIISLSLCLKKDHNPPTGAAFQLPVQLSEGRKSLEQVII